MTRTLKLPDDERTTIKRTAEALQVLASLIHPNMNQFHVQVQKIEELFFH